MPYWKLFYHAVWATRFRERVILPEIEPAIHDLLRSKAVGLGATVFALNGMEDHVHLVVSRAWSARLGGGVSSSRARTAILRLTAPNLDADSRKSCPIASVFQESPGS